MANGYGGGGIFATDEVSISLSGAATVRSNLALLCHGGGIYMLRGVKLVVYGDVAFKTNVANIGGAILAEQKVPVQPLAMLFSSCRAKVPNVASTLPSFTYSGKSADHGCKLLDRLRNCQGVPSLSKLISPKSDCQTVNERAAYILRGGEHLPLVLKAMNYQYLK